MDVTILNYVQDHCHNRFTDVFFTFLSRMGNGGAIWFCFAFYLFSTPHQKQYALMIFFAIAFSHLISQILKPIIGRPRPFVTYPGKQLLIHTPGGYSCPSGHSATSFAAATVLSMVGLQFAVAAFLLAFGIAFSRVFLFVHYPSDTIIGAALGVFCSILIMFLYRI
jgi:undecaprenyl-diphosphatase